MKIDRRATDCDLVSFGIGGCFLVMQCGLDIVLWLGLGSHLLASLGVLQ